MSKQVRVQFVLRYLSVIAFLVSVYLALGTPFHLIHFLLIVLACGASWLRFKLDSGVLTLSPLAVFLALLLPLPQAAPFVASASALLSSLIVHRVGLQVALEYSLSDGLAGLAAFIVLGILHTLGVTNLMAYAGAVFAYALVRSGADGFRTYLIEGIVPVRFVMVAGWKLVLNLIFFGVFAYAIRYYLYDQFGFLALVLATVALAEIYHPWKLLSEQNDALFASLGMVAQAIDLKDPYTARHSRNVAEMAVRIARAMHLSESEVRKIRIGALMHDIGKIGVSGAIIRKPTHLEPDETQAMRLHPITSANIMQPIELLTEAAEIVRHHHEHFNGSGYPAGLKGNAIPIGSRVILVADAFDALTSERPYRRGRTKEEALKVLRDHSGRQFDETVVKALESVLYSI